MGVILFSKQIKKFKQNQAKIEQSILMKKVNKNIIRNILKKKTIER